MSNTEPTQANGGIVTPRDLGNWAKPVKRLNVSSASIGVVPINVAGRQIVGPLQGFGQMWQKTYRVRLSGVNTTPEAVIALWKKQFPDFWPRGNRFYGPLTGSAPGEIGVINLSVGGMRLSTGVMVIYADNESFTFMTPEGHMFAGWITFSAMEEDGATVVQVQALIRANDPIYAMGFRLGFGHKVEDAFWHQTLQNLARHLSVSNPIVQQQVACLDARMQWSKLGNIRHNAAIHTMLYQLAAPVRWLKNRFRR